MSTRLGIYKGLFFNFRRHLSKESMILKYKNLKYNNFLRDGGFTGDGKCFLTFRLCMIVLGGQPCIRLAPSKFELTNQQTETFTVLNSVYVNQERLTSGNFSLWKRHQIFQKKGFINPKARL